MLLQQNRWLHPQFPLMCARARQGLPHVAYARSSIHISRLGEPSTEAHLVCQRPHEGVLHNGRALLVVGDAFGLHPIVYVRGNGFHDSDGEREVRTS